MKKAQDPHVYILSTDDVSRRNYMRLRQAGAILTHDHFVLASLRHSTAYCNVKHVFSGRYPKTAMGICIDLAAPYRFAGIDAVIGPESGAVPIAIGVAKYLSRVEARPVHAITAKKCADGGFCFEKRDRELMSGKKMLVVEDVMTTGRSVSQVAKEIRGIGQHVEGFAAVIDRSGMKPHELSETLEGPIHSLLRLQIDTWENEEGCPICQAGLIPVNPNIGRGKQFLSQRST